MKGIRSRKILDYRELLMDEKQQRAFLGYHPGASRLKASRRYDGKASRSGRFLRVTGEAVSQDSAKWP